MSTMFLASGIAGKGGGTVARDLLEAGRPVRALVRDRARATGWADRGVEVVEDDLTDPDALASALAGVEGVFPMQPRPSA